MFFRALNTLSFNILGFASPTYDPIIAMTPTKFLASNVTSSALIVLGLLEILLLLFVLI